MQHLLVEHSAAVPWAEEAEVNAEPEYQSEDLHYRQIEPVKGRPASEDLEAEAS